MKAPESRLLDDELSAFDALALVNIGRLSRAEAVAIHRFVHRGGGLLVFLGDQVQTENYNQLLVDDTALRCLPARLTELASIGTYAFDALEYRHPIVAPFRGFPKSGLLTTPTWEYVRLTPLEGAKTALSFSSGDPAIVETQIGRGRCILVATAASPDSIVRGHGSPTAWTALPTWPSFPPLVHEMLRWSLTGRNADRNVSVGDDLTGIVPESESDSTILLKGPSGPDERLPIRDEAGERRWVFNRPALSGVYEARLGPMAQHFAVNLDPSEGNLARLDPETLPSQFRHEADSGMREPATVASHDARSYFRWWLGAVFVLLTAEPCLAWLFGRGHT
ncbi:MAG: hypothetical protein JF612_11110 [Planctomycetia bacterium]|nr:hypothetical protein [Planctomycetia bacterium]